MADPRRRDAIWTANGRVIRPLEPDPRDIHPDDVAHHLAQIPRFTGACREPYTVAQHSVHVSQLVERLEGSREERLWALLHDAQEYVLFDMPKPIKLGKKALSEAYREVEGILIEAVAQAFGLSLPVPNLVHLADNVLFQAEARDLMPTEFPRRNLGGPDVTDELWPDEIIPWSHKRAKNQFLWRYKELTR